MNVVDLRSVFDTFSAPWSPKTVATMNDCDVRVVKMEGEFTRHRHPETDEMFLVLRGSLVIRMEDHDVELVAGQLFVVPRGAAHQPISHNGADVLLFEPSETVNTGDNPGELTADRTVV